MGSKFKEFGQIYALFHIKTILENPFFA